MRDGGSVGQIYPATAIELSLGRSERCSVDLTNAKRGELPRAIWRGGDLEHVLTDGQGAKREIDLM